MIEAEGEMHDGRWVNMALEDTAHPLPADPAELRRKGIITQHAWPELHHVVSYVAPDGTAKWKMIRSEVVSEQPWSKPSEADERRGYPPMIDRSGWFGEAPFGEWRPRRLTQRSTPSSLHCHCCARLSLLLSHCVLLHRWQAAHHGG